MVDGHSGLIRQRRGDGDTVVVAEEDDGQVVNRREVRGAVKVGGGGGPVAEVGYDHRVFSVHGLTGCKPYGVRQVVADQNIRQHRTLRQYVGSNLWSLDPVQHLEQGVDRYPAGDGCSPRAHVPEDPIVCRESVGAGYFGGLLPFRADENGHLAATRAGIGGVAEYPRPQHTTVDGEDVVCRQPQLLHGGCIKHLPYKRKHHSWHSPVCKYSL